MAKYGVRRCDWDIPIPQHGCSGFRKGIASVKAPFNAAVRNQVGAGDRIFFWYHPWDGDSPLAT